MKHTSIQNIITDSNHLDQTQIRRLFQRQQYPRFEIRDLRAKPELIKKQPYLAFLGLLEQWNKNVDNPAKEIKECEYRKCEFIFSWLKWVAVQNNSYVDPSLVRLQNWYNNSRLKEPTIMMRRENVMRSFAEEWEIRNSYRSNLPLQIDSYKRRALFEIKTDHSPFGHTQKASQKQNIKVDPLEMKILEYSKMNKTENGWLRQVRQQQEMKDYMTIFRKSKVHFHKNLPKNYYKPEFSNDKITKEYPKIQRNLTKSLQRKDYRIKTSTQGFRQFTRESTFVNSMNQTQMLSPKKSDLLKSDLSYTAQNTTINEQKWATASNIDGIGLMANPFETKIKKKKRT